MRLGKPVLRDSGENVFHCRFGAEELLVHRIRRGSWFAKIRGETEHSRFGDKQQIQEDIAHFFETCSLPRGSRW